MNDSNHLSILGRVGKDHDVTTLRDGSVWGAFQWRYVQWLDDEQCAE